MEIHKYKVDSPFVQTDPRIRSNRLNHRISVMGNSLSKVLATAALLAASHLHHAYLGAPGSINHGDEIPMDNHVFSRHLNGDEDMDDDMNEAEVVVWKAGRSSFEPEEGPKNPYPAMPRSNNADYWEEGWKQSSTAYQEGIRDAAITGREVGQAPKSIPYTDKTLSDNYLKGWNKAAESTPPSVSIPASVSIPPNMEVVYQNGAAAFHRSGSTSKERAEKDIPANQRAEWNRGWKDAEIWSKAHEGDFQEKDQSKGKKT